MADINELLKQLTFLDPAAPDSQFEAAIALSKIETSSSRDLIIEKLIDSLITPHSLTRAHAAESLGILKALTSVPELILSLKDSYRLVRSYAARALGKIGDKSAIEPLLDVLVNDEFFGARAEAAEAL